MRFGLVMRTDVHLNALADLGSAAEDAGWDGFFIWDSFMADNPWMLLATVAMRTERIRLGTMLTPPSRRRPWQLASEVATLDHLSHGRAILPFGLGAADDLGFATVGEVTDRRVRAELLDESIDIITGLWQGEPFSYEGRHYTLREARFRLRPVQSPRVPIWVVGAWPHMKSMRRVLRCDGLMPAKMTPAGPFGEITPDDVRAIKAFVDQHRTLTTPFDIVFEGETPGDDPATASEIVRPLAEAGVTWWLEEVAIGPYKKGGLDGVLRRIRQGPPALQS